GTDTGVRVGNPPENRRSRRRARKLGNNAARRTHFSHGSGLAPEVGVNAATNSVWHRTEPSSIAYFARRPRPKQKQEARMHSPQTKRIAWNSDRPATKKRRPAQQPAQLELTLELPGEPQDVRAEPEETSSERGVAVIDFY